MKIADVKKLSAQERFSGESNITTGVYAIRNIVNGKLYIGSAAISFRVRWAVHRHHLRNGNHHSNHLQRSWNKYGEDCFEFSVLLHCSPKDCIPQEQIRIDEFKTYNPKYGYNVYPNARSPLGTKRPPSVGRAVAESNRKRVVSTETRLKMSKARKSKPRKLKTNKLKYKHWTLRPDAEEIKKRIGFRGKHSDETKSKMSAAHKGKVFTDAHRAAISVALKGRKREDR